VAWIIKGHTSSTQLVGRWHTPGQLTDHSSFCSDLAGLVGTLHTHFLFPFQYYSKHPVIMQQALVITWLVSYKPVKPMEPHADLLEAAQSLLITWRYKIDLVFIQGHQDNGQPTVLSRDAWLNVGADSLVKNKVASWAVPTHFKLLGNSWGCYVGPTRIVKQFNKTLQIWINGKETQEYWEKQTQLQQAQLNNVDWSSISWAMQRVPLVQQHWASKQMSSRFAHGKNMVWWKFCTSAQCPRCREGSKDKTHILKYTQEEAAAKWNESLQTLKAWMKKEKLYVESDTLGVAKTTMVSYLTKIHLYFINHSILNTLLQKAIKDITLDSNLAVDLNPMLKSLYNEAKMNGNMFIPELPPFKLYKTRLTHGNDKSKVEMTVVGIKCVTGKVHLLKEYFLQLASPASYKKQIGVFVPTGVAHLTGAINYAKIICDDNTFSDNVITIPVSDFQHATLDIPFSLQANMDIEQVMLNDLICDQTWCYNVKWTTIPTKILVVVNKANLDLAWKWIDETLPKIYAQHTSNKLDVTMLQHMIPCCLNKPIMIAATTAYTKQLQQCTTIVHAPAKTPKPLAKPPCVCKTHLVDITFNEKEFPSLPTSTPTMNTPTTTVPTTSQAMTSTVSTIPSPLLDWF